MLHEGYVIQTQLSNKYNPQFAVPFKILERIGRLAYKLDKPTRWRIHPVTSVEFLENSI